MAHFAPVSWFFWHNLLRNQWHIFTGFGGTFCSGLASFLMNPQGELLWERTIADIRNSDGGRFWHGQSTTKGFAFIGDIDLFNPTGVPFLNDPDLWFVTLDENGCWNDNCHERIVITGNATSTTTDSVVTSTTVNHQAMEIKLYPNPTNGILIIESGVKKPRLVRIHNAIGETISEFSLNAPKSTINLSHLDAGVYWISQIVDRQTIRTSKIIIKH